MPAPIYVINLDRSVDRLATLEESAARQGLIIRRVPAINGLDVVGDLPHRSWPGYDAAGFESCHGHRALPAEYGCYFSHLTALKQIASQPEPYGVIVEDDVRFVPTFAERLEAVMACCEQAAVVKLYSSRLKGFLTHAKTTAGDRIGKATHGPYGCAAAYLVSRAAAGELSRKLNPMRLPFDIALERDWFHKVPVYSVFDPMIEFHAIDSTITPIGTTYRASKLPTWKRLPVLGFRAVDYVRRTVTALRETALAYLSRSSKLRGRDLPEGSRHPARPETHQGKAA